MSTDAILVLMAVEPYGTHRDKEWTTDVSTVKLYRFIAMVPDGA